MNTSRKSIEKEIVKELRSRLAPLGWSLLESDTNYFAKKYSEDIRWGFTFSLYISPPRPKVQKIKTTSTKNYSISCLYRKYFVIPS